jgi:hypothetical protein
VLGVQVPVDVHGPRVLPEVRQQLVDLRVHAGKPVNA